MKRVFVYAELFEQALRGRTSASEIIENVESSILSNPSCGDIIAGTGGVRKLRSEDSSRSKGRRGGYRVLFLDLPHVERTHLIFLYDKGEADNLTIEGRRYIKVLVEKIKGAQ